MKAFSVLIAIVIVIIVAGTSLAQVEVKQVPLTWQQAAITDGEGLYLELCAVCHGTGGKGDGPAAPALKKAMPDLTALAAANEGEFPRQDVEQAIAGKSRVSAHGTVDMPIWGWAFENVRPDRRVAQRKAFARQRIYNLTEYLATIQAE